jgi:hypothetical protein
MAWPKIILVRGLQIPVDNWDEVDEAVERYGGEPLVVTTPSPRGEGERSERQGQSRQGAPNLSADERALLRQFIEGGARGVLTSQIGPVLGAQGKGMRPALERWSRRIGLVTGDSGSAFVPYRRNDGRAYRLTDVHLRGARELLGTG